MKTAMFDTGTVRIHYLEGPANGEPLLLLHSLTSGLVEFRSLIPDLTGRFHVFAVDFRGHGQSGRAQSYRIEDLATDIETFVRDNIREPTIVFGHSLGGMVGLMVGASRPELVNALIVGESIISADFNREFATRHEPKTRFWRTLAQMPSVERIVAELRSEPMPAPESGELVPARQILGDDHPSFRFFAECLSRDDPEMLTANIEGFAETYAAYRPEVFWPLVRCPVLLLQGNPKLGGLMRDGDIDVALRLLPDGRRVRIDTAGHALHLQDRAAVLSAAVSFLASIPQDGASRGVTSE